jgi:hypothetical protein
MPSCLMPTLPQGAAEAPNAVSAAQARRDSPGPTVLPRIPPLDSLPLASVAHMLPLARRRSLFTPAQAHGAHPLAPYAWADTVTKSTNAWQSSFGTEKRPVVRETARAASSTQVESSYAPTGNALPAVPAQALATITSAPVAERTITELRNALEHRKSKALTPYHHKKWHLLLSRHNLLDKYPSLPHSLQFGFDAGIPPIHSTYTPNNSPTIYVHSQQYHEIIDREFSSGRYFGPLSKEVVKKLLGPFQSSPLSLIPKPGKPGKYRSVHNFSFPHSPHNNIHSINHHINTDSFPCTGGHSRPSARSSGTSHQDPRPRSKMWQKHIEPFPLSQASGQGSLSGYKAKISS